MKKITTTIALLLILSFVLVSLPEINIVQAEPKTIIVPDDFSTIQEAIDNAVEGDTVFVKAGVYFENVDVDKSLSLVGENKETTIIDGGKSGVVVKILRDRTNITSFTIQNSNDDTSGLAPWLPITYSGIQLFEASYCNITGNKIIDNYYGIYLTSSSNHNSIFGNTITNNRFLGIALDSSSNNRFRNNNIADNRYHFRVAGNELSHFINDIDTSNLVDGKPIYYWVSRNNEIISMDAGYVALVNCVNITIQSLDLSGSNYDGIFLAYTKNSTIKTNHIANNRNGIRLSHSSEHNILLDNILNNNENGIYLSGSSNNNIFRNTINGNSIEDDRLQAGILVSSSSENDIVENQIAENSDYGIYFGGTCQYNDIIRNNITKNWDAGIKFDAGGTVDDFYSSNYSSLIGNNIKENGNGILISSSYGNKILGNNIMDNTDRGIDLYGSRSQKSQIFGNNITTNHYGFDFSGDVKNNSIIGNNIQNNEVGIRIYKSNSNEFYHNNFINNINQVFIGESTNIWDDGSEGNYWDNYTGIDNDNNRIGDTPHIIDANNLDRYPLIIPLMTHFYVFDAGIWEWTPFFVYVVSNSTVSEFSFSPNIRPAIPFNINGETGTTGFCNVTIPKDLLYTEGNWIVQVDGYPVTPTVNEDQNSSYLYFTYQQSSTKTVEIIGTDAIPEFPSWTPLLIMLVAVMVVAVIYKQRLRPQPTNN